MIRFLQGDTRDILPTLESGSVDCCVTSPPYFWLRDYGVDGQIGHEPDVQSFVTTLGNVFDEVRRVLKPTGTLWLNLGDSYYSGNGQPHGSDPRSSSRNFRRRMLSPLDTSGMCVPKKSLLGIPWLVALELQRRGWTLRSDIIWCRPTALDEPSVTDRPSRQHEHLFLLAQGRRYFFDKSALPEGSVWHIPHERGALGHSAAFPEQLASRCIRAGCPVGGVVLDPFGGIGTTGLAAQRNGRSAILIELNPAFLERARQRIEGDAPLLAETAA